MAKRKVLETGVVNLGKWGHKELWDYEIFEDERSQKRKYIMRPGQTPEVDPKTNKFEDIVYFETLFDPCHLNTSFYAGGGGSNCRFSRLIKKRSKGITVVVMDACHSEGRYFVNEGLNADDQHNGYGPEVLVSKKKRKKTLTNQSD